MILEGLAIMEWEVNLYHPARVSGSSNIGMCSSNYHQGGIQKNEVCYQMFDVSHMRDLTLAEMNKGLFGKEMNF